MNTFRFIRHRFYAKIICTILSSVFSFVFVFAQISPGKLSKAHASLEGISNCTACHDLGAKVSEKKCLECHSALSARISQNKGYHSSKEIKGKTCISCHSEHHGVNFQMIRFDQKTFNHSLTGYELKGEHKVIDCAQCHKPENIYDTILKKNKNTFLGLSPTCISCHSDYHQKTLGNDCASCHNFETFVPASLFNHQKTSFPLVGSHVNVDCINCHKKESRNGKTFQKFDGIPFSNCNVCHKDPHGGGFGNDCKSCHSEESFRKIKNSPSFNHSLTGFDLEGKHRVIDCKKCHDQRQGTVTLFGEFKDVVDITCLTCHEDSHENKLGNQCLDCHQQNSFNIKDRLKEFQHQKTGFELLGKHVEVDCRKCHTGKYMTEPLAHNTCNACHQDYHKGAFKDTPYVDCISCHSNESFTESSFDFEKHNVSKFPLKGAHLATPCIACHQLEGEWRFRDIGQKCIDCHQNIHLGFLDEKFLPNNDCTHCHLEDSWTFSTFDHKLTDFELLGKHKSIQCRSCHFITDDFGKTTQKFSNIDPSCVNCHNNVHGTQFDTNGVTDCKRCHGFNTFARSEFNHNDARFILEGAHLKVSCDACHKPEIIDGQSIILYKTGKLACSDCHL
ncbi:MAG: cytochrome c3 family protein [Saprospiraceae bacterium]